MDKSVESNVQSDLTKLSFEEKYCAKNYNPLSIPLNANAQHETIDLIRRGDIRVLDGLLETTDDPRIILKAARNACFDGFEITIISGYKQNIWEWDKNGMVQLLKLSGFRVGRPKMKQDNTFEIKVSSNRVDYDKYLLDNHLPGLNVRHLIVTTEHSGYRLTGGIGSYVKECTELYGDDVAILILDSNADYDKETIARNRWAAAQLFLSTNRIDIIKNANFDTIGDLTYEVLQSILFLYPTIKSIEAQEMLLNRTIEAKRLQKIDSDIQLITVCHGSSFHLAKAGRKVIDAENIHVAYREKFSIEHSDITIFPTRFLRESYRQSGIENLDASSRIIKRLPFDYKRLPDGKKLVSYRRLIYIGKTSTVKGFDLFLETLMFIHKHNPSLMRQFEEIKVIATTTKIHERVLQEMYKEVEAKLPITMVSLGREELLDELAKYSEDSLALITYRGDNHPLTVLELMGVGHDFIAADAAGTPELIPDDFKKDYLVAPDAATFANTIARLSCIVPERARRIVELRQTYIRKQEEINASYSLETLESYRNIVDATEALRNSYKRAKIGVYVGGQGRGRMDTIASIEAQIDVDAYILKNGVEHDSYDAIMNIKAGDILYPRALVSMYSLLTSRPNVGAVLSYGLVPAYVGKKLLGIKEFHPSPPELGSVFLQEKCGRRVVTLIRADVYKESNLSEWQKCIDLTCGGQEVAIVPEVLMELAVVKDYPNHDLISDSANLVRSFSVLPVFDAYILHSELKRFDDIYWGAELLNHLSDVHVRRDDPNIIWRNDPEYAYMDNKILRVLMRIYHTRVPGLVRRSLSTTSRIVYRLARIVKHKNRH